MKMQVAVIVEHGASKLFRKIPGILRVVIVLQDRRRGRDPANGRSTAVSGGRAPVAA